jgi:hypothetical protein
MFYWLMVTAKNSVIWGGYLHLYMLWYQEPIRQMQVDIVIRLNRASSCTTFNEAQPTSK